MPSAFDLATAAAIAVVLVFGIQLTLYAYRAFRRTGAVGLRTMGGGIACVTVGAVSGAGLHHLAGVAFEAALFVQTGLTAFGFLVLVASLYLRDPPEGTGPRGV